MPTEFLKLKYPRGDWQVDPIRWQIITMSTILRGSIKLWCGTVAKCAVVRWRRTPHYCRCTQSGFRQSCRRFKGFCSGLWQGYFTNKTTGPSLHSSFSASWLIYNCFHIFYDRLRKRNAGTELITRSVAVWLSKQFYKPPARNSFFFNYFMHCYTAVGNLFVLWSFPYKFLTYFNVCNFMDALKKIVWKLWMYNVTLGLY